MTNPIGTALVVPTTPAGQPVGIANPNSDAVPVGATVLASSGFVKPTTSNGLPFFTPTVPVHVDPRGAVFFYIASINSWITPTGAVAQ